ncbi:hypothetical protein K2X96_00560 [Patescibacteria group bacterium]|nr:hypothetical protein [Patescibacteria group bacterium]
MQNTYIGIAAGLVLLLGGLATVTYMQQKDADTVEESEVMVETETETTSQEMRIDAKHFFSSNDGVHTLVGEILMPTPCDLLTYTPTVLENGKRVEIAFSVTNNSGDSCVQMVTPQRFSVTFKAEKDAVIEAYYQGARASLNIFPAKDGEDPTDFELFIKG